MKLHDLIAALQQQAEAHKDVDCEVWVYDKKTKDAHSATDLPLFEFHSDEVYGDWLAIDFRGKHHDN